MKVKFHRSDNSDITINRVTTREYDDDTPDRDIQDDLEQWMWEDIDIWYEKLDDNAEDEEQ